MASEAGVPRLQDHLGRPVASLSRAGRGAPPNDHSKAALSLARQEHDTCWHGDSGHKIVPLAIRM
jgi:hypothetical protein